MALYDPDAAGNAAPYLRLDPVLLMEVRSAPFEGKTAVWVPYSETGYTKVSNRLYSSVRVMSLGTRFARFYSNV